MKKIVFFKLKKDSKSANEKHTLDLDAPELNPHMNMKNEVLEVLEARSLLLDDLNLDLNTLQVGMDERVETMNFFFSLWRWKMTF